MRRRPVRFCDIATSLYYYLMFINIAGTHAYAAIGANPEYHAPPTQALVQQANAQVAKYKGQMPPGPEPTPKERREILSAEAKGLLQQLDAYDKTLASDDPDPARWDAMIHAAEQTRVLGERMAAEAKPLERAKKKLGVELATRGAATQARLALLISKIHGGPLPFRWDYRDPSSKPTTQPTNITPPDPDD